MILDDFLALHNLSQYHAALLSAGASNDDLPHILQMNDQEVNELACAIGMLPFHTVKFKRALREYKSSFPVQSTNTIIDPLDTPPLTNDDQDDATSQSIITHAKIYGKNNTRPLTRYEIAINHASVQLALQTPALVLEKGRLFDLAKKKLISEGYQYKRGKTRSKFKEVCGAKKMLPSRKAKDRASPRHLPRIEASPPAMAAISPPNPWQTMSLPSPPLDMMPEVPNARARVLTIQEFLQPS